MRSMSQNPRASSGFTLVEVLIIAPIIILVIAGFIALIITVTGDVLRTKGSNDLVYTTEDALARIEQDVLRTAEFRQTSYTPTSPQGQSDDTTAFDTISQAGTYLVLRSRATDKSPIADTRVLIFTASGMTCSTSPYTFDIVYFTKVASGITSLWRRVVFGNTTDAGTPCSGTTPWQQPTCSPGYVNAFCKAEDALLLDNISTVTLQYLNVSGAQINTTTPTAGTAIRNPNDAAGTTNASSITVTFSVTNTVAGRNNTYTGTLTAKKSG